MSCLICLAWLAIWVALAVYVENPLLKGLFIIMAVTTIPTWFHENSKS